MSTAITVKEEILAQKTTAECCRLAFLAGAIAGCGSLSIGREGLGLILQNQNEELIKKCASLLSQITGKEPAIVKKDKEMSLGQRVVYEIRLDAATASPILQSMGIFEPPYGIAETASPQTVEEPCCKKSYLKGVFCAAGSLTLSGDTQKANSKGYSLEILLSTKQSALFAAEVMERLGVKPSVRSIRNNYRVYLKDSEKIGDLLIALGATGALYTLNNIIASRSLRNDANRRTNCEVANIDKTLTASSKQLDAIAFIEKRAGLSYLEEYLRDTAETRRAYPDASLTELLKHLKYPTSRSGLNHRLRKIIQIADELRGKND